MTAVLLAAAGAHATLIEIFNTINTAIPEGNPVGVASSETVSDAGGSTVSGLTVTLNVSGGYNGYLYSYLVAPNGTMTVLLNQPGATGNNPFWYSGSGLNVTLSDTGVFGIQRASRQRRRRRGWHSPERIRRRGAWRISTGRRRMERGRCFLRTCQVVPGRPR